MGFFNFNKKKTEEIIVDSQPLYSQFSTPFGKIGDGNLSLPYVRTYGSELFVRFGNDNLYPQIINQMYYQSPLNQAIINYKANAVIGGGIEVNSVDTSGPQKVKEYTFMRKNKFAKLMRQLTKDLIMHGRVCVLINPSENCTLKRVGPERVRVNKIKTIYTVSEDWSLSSNITQYPAYSPNLKVPSMFVYEIDGDAGQDVYPIPGYCSALNWCFVDGESSYLHKSNIINSIFPSFMLTLAKKMQSQEEIDQFKKTIDAAKGAPAAGRIMTFVGQDPTQLPTITPIPTNQNDKLFTQTDERIDANISRGHSIDPILMGIRVSGKLGSGADIQIAYTIFEKNVIMPLREMMEEVGDELMSIGEINSTITINNYQIIGDVIVDKTVNELE